MRCRFGRGIDRVQFTDALQDQMIAAGAGVYEGHFAVHHPMTHVHADTLAHKTMHEIKKRKRKYNSKNEAYLAARLTIWADV